MKLKQKVYELGSDVAEPLQSNDLLYLVINNNATTIPLKEMFEGYNQKADSISGWSIFQAFEIDEDGQLCYKDEENNINIKCHFINSRNGQRLVVVKRRNPTIIWNDKKIDDKTKLEKLNRLIAFTNHVVDNSQNGIKKEQPNINETSEKLDENSESENKKESEPKTELFDEPEKYRSDADELIQQGYNEHKKDNYRLLYNERGGHYIVEILPDGYEPLHIQSVKGNGKYTIIDKNGKPLNLSFDVEINEVEEIN